MFIRTHICMHTPWQVFLHNFTHSFKDYYRTRNYNKCLIQSVYSIQRFAMIYIETKSLCRIHTGFHLYKAISRRSSRSFLISSVYNPLRLLFYSSFVHIKITRNAKLFNIALYIRPCSNKKKSNSNESKNIQCEFNVTNSASGIDIYC